MDPRVAAIERGARALNEGRGRRQPKRDGLRMLPPRDIGRRPRGPGGGASSGTGVSSSSGSASSSSSPQPSLPSEAETDDENSRREVRQVRARIAAPAWTFGGGQILNNQSNESLDVRCNICGAGHDRKYTPFRNARSAHTRAQGRMLGSHFAWLSLDCRGDSEWHLAQYCDAALPRHDRKQRRLEAFESGEFQDLFRLERDPRSDESDGEPRAVPVRGGHRPAA